MKSKPLRNLTYGAVIAALYVILTELTTLAGLSSGAIQFRLSEALCILPAFTPTAIPALSIGCLISNLLAGGSPQDLLFGALATLIGAVGAYLLRRRKYLVPLPTVLANMLILPFVLRVIWDFPGAHWYFTLTIGVGELICAYLLGILLFGVMQKYRNHLFPL